jgi:hypothetical protein
MTKWDKYLIVTVIIVSLIGLYLVKVDVTNEGTLYVEIQVDGKLYKKISLGPNMEGKTLEVKTEFGYNKIEFSQDRVRVIEADCPDKLDVLQGWISRPGEVIVCLPNRLVIELVTEKEQLNDIDNISY